MIDPNNVLIRCPNGHDLQAARSELDQDLACPICQITFRPGGVNEGDAVPGTLGYASINDVGPRRRARYPAYTPWLIGLWVTAYAGLAMSTIIDTLSSTHGQAGVANANMPAVLVQTMFTCLFFCCFAAAAVMQLMWIHRVHFDARQYGGYQRPTPGLALGLSFIPIFNQLWTAFAILRLSNFAAEGDRAKDPTASSAVHIAKTCFITGIVLVIMTCILFGISSASMWQAYTEITQQGLDPNKPEVRAQLQAAATASPVLVIAAQLLQLAGVMVYAFAVKRMEAALYSRFGAIPR